MVFFDKGTKEGVERLAIARYDVGTLLKGEWDLNTNPDQWDALIKVIREKNPKKIGLNFSKHYAHADGLTYTEHKELMEKLPDEFQKRVVSAANLAVNWLETRTEREMIVYQQICRISHDIIQEAFSDKVIQPGGCASGLPIWDWRPGFIRQWIFNVLTRRILTTCEPSQNARKNKSLCREIYSIVISESLIYVSILTNSNTPIS